VVAAAAPRSTVTIEAFETSRLNAARAAK